MNNPFEEQYNYISDPVNFIENFPDKESFVEWLKEGDINDLRFTLKAFEDSELFEHCVTIQAELDLRIDKMLSGFGFE